MSVACATTANFCTMITLNSILYFQKKKKKKKIVSRTFSQFSQHKNAPFAHRQNNHMCWVFIVLVTNTRNHLIFSKRLFTCKVDWWGIWIGLEQCTLVSSEVTSNTFKHITKKHVSSSL